MCVAKTALAPCAEGINKCLLRMPPYLVSLASATPPHTALLFSLCAAWLHDRSVSSIGSAVTGGATLLAFYVATFWGPPASGVQLTLPLILGLGAMMGVACAFVNHDQLPFRRGFGFLAAFVGVTFAVDMMQLAAECLAIVLSALGDWGSVLALLGRGVLALLLSRHALALAAPAAPPAAPSPRPALSKPRDGGGAQGEKPSGVSFLFKGASALIFMQRQCQKLGSVQRGPLRQLSFEGVKTLASSLPRSPTALASSLAAAVGAAVASTSGPLPMSSFTRRTTRRRSLRASRWQGAG